MGRDVSEINMVAAAVRIAGTKLGAKNNTQCVRLVAERLKVSRAAIYKWIDQKHMRRAALETVLELSDFSGVPIRELSGPAPTLRSRH
jgi:hypothetical protein